jgi:hypothetical protein
LFNKAEDFAASGATAVTDHFIEVFLITHNGLKKFISPHYIAQFIVKGISEAE